MANDYYDLMRLWNAFNTGMDDHDCTDAEFTMCDICERAAEARWRLGSRVTEVMQLLETYHDRLEDLTTAVIQETNCPRPARLQESMLQGRALLDKA